MANTIARHDRRGWRLDKPSLAQPNDSIGVRTRGSRCAICAPRHERAHGRNTAEWQRLRAARRHLDGHRCTICGSTEDLTVDLDERLHGQHRGATLADCRTLCRSCNSSLGSGSPRACSPLRCP